MILVYTKKLGLALQKISIGVQKILDSSNQKNS